MEAKGDSKLKLLNLNLGIKIDNNEDVIKLINKEKVDIVTFQEAMQGKENTVKGSKY